HERDRENRGHGYCRHHHAVRKVHDELVLEDESVGVERRIAGNRQRILVVVVALRSQAGDDDVVDGNDGHQQPEPATEAAENVRSFSLHHSPACWLSILVAPESRLSPSPSPSPTTTRMTAMALACP